MSEDGTTSPLSGYFNEHLKELRRRITVSFLFVVIASIVCYLFARPLARFIIEPLFDAYPDLTGLVYTNLPEAFVSYLKISILFGLAISFPFVLYQAWMFVAPGLRRGEKSLAVKVVFWASILFAGGVFFAFFVVMPKALSFFMSFAGGNLEPLPKLDAYLTFIARSVLAFGIAFEIPFLMVVTGRTGMVDRKYFSQKRWVFYVAILVLAFLLTVGDLLSTLLLAVPLFGLYEAGVLVMKIFS